ncbi:hypothetical protein BSL78_25968 [Apostichopus japonicus]|uniref:Uncharacterized protein n=1 Tax=Stichopus japonicus TaxID=307972 RepID=A0A2G8JNC9_STIJA|nr:hypothetical protein BSL78_25968 [Apostichopus japonicus]
MNKVVVVPLRCWVLFRYHLRARTGHHSLSSAIEERDFISGIKMSPGRKDRTWFLARKAGSGTILTPWFSNLIWFCLVERAWRQLLLLADARAIRNSVFFVRDASEAEAMGSYGGLVSVCSAADKLHEGASRLIRGRLFAIPLMSWEMSLLLPGVDPSANPRCITVIADL